MKIFTNTRDQFQKKIAAKRSKSQSVGGSAQGGGASTHDRVECVKVMRQYVRLIQSVGSEIIDGKAIFKSMNDATIKSHAATMDGDCAAARYNKALKELWKNVENKGFYEEEAKKLWDIEACVPSLYWNIRLMTIVQQSARVSDQNVPPFEGGM